MEILESTLRPALFPAACRSRLILRGRLVGEWEVVGAFLKVVFFDARTFRISIFIIIAGTILLRSLPASLIAKGRCGSENKKKTKGLIDAHFSS
jgi:hypothetical protein